MTDIQRVFVHVSPQLLEHLLALSCGRRLALLAALHLGMRNRLLQLPAFPTLLLERHLHLALLYAPAQRRERVSERERAGARGSEALAAAGAD